MIPWKSDRMLGLMLSATVFAIALFGLANCGGSDSEEPPSDNTALVWDLGNWGQANWQ